MPRRTCAFLVVLALAFTGCASVKAPAGAAKEPPQAAPPAPRPAVGIVQTARPLDFGALIDRLAHDDVVYVGEVHTDAAEHAVQLRIVSALWAKGRLQAIGMEMFQRKKEFQKALDDYVEGKIDEAALLERTQWKKRWGFPFALYRPILEFAREKRLPVIALNIPDEIRREVDKGGLEAVPESQRAELPVLHTHDAAHRDFLHRIYLEHLPPGKKPDEKAFDRFYLVMCLWDDGMADSIVRWFRTAPQNAQIVVLAGRGHMANRYGIPARVERRIGRPYDIVVPLEVEESPDDHVYSRRYADFLWFVNSPPKPETSKKPEAKKPAAKAGPAAG